MTLGKFLSPIFEKYYKLLVIFNHNKPLILPTFTITTYLLFIYHETYYSFHYKEIAKGYNEIQMHPSARQIL